MIDIVNGLRRIAEEGYRFAGDATDEIERLRAKITEMEQQEPVAYLPLSSARILESGVIANAVVWNCRDKAASDMPLYALPGAQPAPSVPDGSAVQTSARKENDNVATYRNGT